MKYSILATGIVTALTFPLSAQQQSVTNNEQAGVVLNEPLTTASYTLFDVMVGYNFGNYQLSLQAQNITDKTVITSCPSRLKLAV